MMSIVINKLRKKEDIYIIMKNVILQANMSIPCSQ